MARTSGREPHQTSQELLLLSKNTSQAIRARLACISRRVLEEEAALHWCPVRPPTGTTGYQWQPQHPVAAEAALLALVRTC